MTWEEALAILAKQQEEAIRDILALPEKAEKYDQLIGPPDPGAPPGMTPTYQKENHRGWKRKPGRKKGHAGTFRKPPQSITDYQSYTLFHCSQCGEVLGAPTRQYQCLIEDIPRSAPQVTQHTIHGYWCRRCRKIVTPTVTEALPNSNLGIRLVVYTAWLHFMVGVSVKNLVKVLSAFSGFSVSPGGLTQAWIQLAKRLKPEYEALGRNIAASAVLHADETGWRLSGVTHWLFTTPRLCYYLITPGRGAPVVKKILGTLFQGILITDFFAAYNAVAALAKQRCFYHLFTEIAKMGRRNNSLFWHLFRKQLSRLLKDAIHLSEKRPSFTAQVFEHRKSRLHARLNQFCAAIQDPGR